jgi:hypothetical protein
LTYPPPYSSSEPSDNTSSSYQGAPATEGSPNTNPATGNVAASSPTVLIYLKDGTTYTASDYWLANNQLHYYVDYSGENTIEMDQLDLQRTVDENAKRGVRFTLKPKPSATNPAPSTNSTPASDTDRSSPGADQTTQDNSAPVTTQAQ